METAQTYLSQKYYENLDAEVANLKAQYSKLVEINQALSKENESLQHFRRAYENNVQSETTLKSEIFDLKKKLMFSAEQLTMIEGKTQNQERELNRAFQEMSLQHQTALSDLENASQQVKNKHAQIQTLKISLAKMEESNSSYHTQLELVIQEKEKSISMMAALDGRLRELTNKSETEKAFYEEALSLYDSKMTKLSQTLTKEKQHYSQMAKHYELEITGLKGQLTKINEAYIEAKKQATQGIEKTTLLQQELSLHAEQARKLETQVRELQKSLSQNETYINSEKTSYSTLQAQYESQSEVLKNLNASLASEQARVQELQAEIDQLQAARETEISNYRNEIEAVLRSYSLIELEVQSERDNVAYFQNEMKVQNEIYNLKVDELEAALSSTMAGNSGDIEVLNFEINQAASKIEALQNKLSKSLSLVKQLIFDKANLLQTETELRQLLASQEKSFNDQLITQEQVYNLNLTSQAEYYNAQLSSQKQSFTAQLSEQANTFTAKLFEQEKSFKIELESQTGQLRSHLADQQQSYQTQIDEQSRIFVSEMLAHEESYKRQIAAQQSDFDSQMNEMNQLFQDVEANMQEVSTENTSLQKQLNAQKIENVSLKGQISELNEVCHDLSQNLSASQLTQSTLQKSFEDLQVVHARSQSEWQETVQNLKQEIAMQASRYQTREVQLRNYLAFIQNEKEKNQKTLLQMGRDIYTAITIHPLRDCLQVTETQLSQVECELKKTPTIAPQRQTLELMVDQLMGQRNLIRTLLEDSQKSLAKKLTAIETTGHSVAHSQLPPLPPEK